MSVGVGGCTGVVFVVVVDCVVFVVGMGMGGLRGMVLVVRRLRVVIRMRGCFGVRA